MNQKDQNSTRATIVMVALVQLDIAASLTRTQRYQQPRSNQKNSRDC